MPLLNRPDPVIAKRQYRVRIDEPLALMMERYAEFLDANESSVDHVISEALAFVFRKDTEFKAWLAKHPQANPVHHAEAPMTKPNGTMAAKGAPEMAATARATI